MSGLAVAIVSMATTSVVAYATFEYSYLVIWHMFGCRIPYKFYVCTLRYRLFLWYNLDFLIAALIAQRACDT